MYRSNMESDEILTVYHGSRSEDFKKLIYSLLKKGNLKEKYIEPLLDEDSMKVYDTVFTAESANPENNYQVFEQLGDVTANAFIVWYMYRRFPQLMCTEGVKVVARLRINYGSKQSFAKIAEALEFWPFISATDKEKSSNKKSLLEDTFEAFIGATQYLLDNQFRNGVGNTIIYDILKNIFDGMDISLKYEDLYDAKTRLKEVFDLYGESKLGTIIYAENKTDKLTESIVYQVIGSTQKLCDDCMKDTGRGKRKGGSYIELGRGYAALKADAQQKAALQGIDKMRLRGFHKEIPEIYEIFCK